MTEREPLEELPEMQEKLEMWEIEGAQLRRDLNQPRCARKQPEMENDIELDRLRHDVSRLEQELEFTKRFNDQCRKHDKAMQDLKDMHCAEWKRAAEEAQKQLQSALLQAAMQNRADDAAKKAQEAVQLELNRLNEQVNKNINALQDMLEEQNRVADVIQALRDAQIMVEELNLRPLAPLVASTCNPMVVSASPDTGVDVAAFCLITPPIAPGINRSEMAVASVKFTLQSHDQGWATVGRPGTSSSPPSKQYVEYPSGTYQGSRTWFQAAIIRDSNPDLATMLLGMGVMSNDTLIRQTNPNQVFYSESWHIQHNICASSETRAHVVTWSRLGNGTGSGFLSALAPGDRIAVIARAKVRN